jgi:hypothetical protein
VFISTTCLFEQKKKRQTDLKKKEKKNGNLEKNMKEACLWVGIVFPCRLHKIERRRRRR